MIEQLFGSKTRVKLLQLFYSNPNRAFYVREITRKIDEQINSVRRELANLLSVGIIKSDTTNNRLYYEVNQTYEYYEPFAVVFGQQKVVRKKDEDTKEEVVVVKAEEATNPEAAAIAKLGNVEVALLTGQFTRDDSSGVDLLVVGDVNKTKLEKYVEELERREGKEVRYAVLQPAQFQYRRQIKDRFVALVLAAKKQVLIDKQNMLD